MEHVLGALGIWLVWNVAETWLEFPRWVWYLFAALLGVGVEALNGTDRWWLGVGTGGLAALIMLTGNLLLVTSDAATVDVLRRSRR